jgi:tRNA threonylcarbamoyladenosine biosynthesis protein TsaE
MPQAPKLQNEGARTLTVSDEAGTRRVAAALAVLARPGDVIGLGGTLGVGKTTFARAFIRAQTTPDEEVPSPTFTLVQTYDGAAGPIWHFDLYRIEDPEAAWELGIEEAFAEAIALIEWPERLGELIPEDRLLVELAPGATETARVIRLLPGPAWRDRLARLDPGTLAA